MFATTVVTAALSVVYRYLSIWENNKRDKSGTLEGYEHAYDDDLTDTKVCLDREPIVDDCALLM